MSISRRPGARFDRGRIPIFSGGSSEWNPASVSSGTLSADYDARKGVTFSTATAQVPAGGPAVTLSGSLGPFTTNPGNLNIITRADGVTFDYSFDGGVTWPDGVNGRTIPNGGTYQPPSTAAWPSPPLFTFPAGTYATRFYAPVLTQWLDQSGASHTLVPAGVSGPVVTSRGRSVNIFGRGRPGVAGRTAISANGSNAMKVTDSLAQAVFGSTAGTAKSFDVWLVASNDFHGAAAQTFASAGMTTATNPLVNMGETATTNHTAATWANDANVGGGAAGTDTVDTRGAVWRFVYDGASFTAYRNGVSVATGAGARGAVTNINTFSLFGLFYRNAIIQPSWNSIARCLVYAGALNSGDAATVLAQLQSIHDCQIPRDVRVSIDGDSFAATTGGESAWPNVMIFGNDSVTLVNAAVAGSDMTAVIGRAATVDANYNAGSAKNILFVQVGTNDLASAAGAEGTLRTQLTSYITARKAVGWYVIINTIIPRAGTANASFATEAAAQNAWRLSGGSGANAVVDTSTTWAGTPSDFIWYRDDIHPGDQGASWFADRMEIAYRAA